MYCRVLFFLALKEHNAELVEEQKKALLQSPSQFLSLRCILISKSYISQVIAYGGDTSSTNKQTKNVQTNEVFFFPLSIPTTRKSSKDILLCHCHLKLSNLAEYLLAFRKPAPESNS